jgi:UDP-galactopyranose mutase
VRGTVLGFEFTGRADALLPHRAAAQQGAQHRYQDHLRAEIGADRRSSPGASANYGYIDMDDCMRQALDAADEVLAAVAAPAGR